MVYSFNSSLRCADFTRARKASLADRKPEFIIIPVTLLPCYAVSRMVAFSHVIQVFIFQVLCSNQFSGEERAAGHRDLAVCRDVDTICQQ